MTALRTPASVVGDGKHSIQWLMDEVNKDSRRGYGHEKVLTQITMDQFTQKMLDDLGYTLDTVPAEGERVLLKPTANLSTGGTSNDVTDEVHPANIFMFERIGNSNLLTKSQSNFKPCGLCAKSASIVKFRNLKKFNLPGVSVEEGTNELSAERISSIVISLNK